MIEFASTHSGPKCSPGWANRCAAATCKKCRCACGGANHGREAAPVATATDSGAVIRTQVAGGRSARYAIERDTPTHVVLRDLGPWERHLTITNDAEDVVARELGAGLGSRRLFYIDSEGNTDELLVVAGRFAGFKHGGPTE